MFDKFTGEDVRMVESDVGSHEFFRCEVAFDGFMDGGLVDVKGKNAAYM